MLALSATVWGSLARWQLAKDPWWTVSDIALGVASFVLVHYRRRWPVPVALLTAAVAGVSGTAAGPAVLAAVSMSTRRRWREIAQLSVVTVIATSAWTTLTLPTQTAPLWGLLGLNTLATGATVGWGMYLGSRRELVWALRQRAERAEAEQELRAAQSRSNERARIAREMHDVLAHRISRIAMQAGALGYRDDLDMEQMRAGTAVIKDQAHEALTELRAVLGVLRDADGAVLDAPLPTYTDLPDLVAQARESGLRVEFVDGLVDADPPPDTVGRALYRVVQEALTNAAKHAPGATVVVELDGDVDRGVTLRVRNPLGFARTRTPGARLGLIGLTERAEQRGGRLEHGVRGDEFVLSGWLPWAA
ncbi:histidine kinase [Nocardioides sp. CBS4Y-1]|uniref:histidine kinase n=2 Tax=Nocardioides acrostichi TaxID=2784339 RepID=A0A930UXI7_9ACTN|nr:histidine kinase [Nocardioides acrostichi]